MSEKIKGKPNSNTNDDVVESIFGETLPKEVMENLGWFGRLKKSIISGERKEIPHGLWKQCPECRHTTIKEDIQENFFLCPTCNYHYRIGSREYFNLLFDNQEYTILFQNISSKDFLNFVDLKPYKERLNESNKKFAHLSDAMCVALGLLKQQTIVIACMDFEFIGGSLGSVVGERFARAVDLAIQKRSPFMVISKSGGARMMESAFSLMQMPKTCAKLSELSDAGLPFISLLTDPTFGGVTASFAMLGDFNIAEPNALIGFAGPRVVKETIRKDLPKGFQRSEFLLEHGFLDFIVDRKELKDKIASLISFFK